LKIATTTADFSSTCQTEEEKLRKLHQAGFRFVDLNLDIITEENSPFMQDDWQTAVHNLKAVAKELNLTFVQAHSPGLNILTDDPEEFAQINAYMVRSIEICQMLGIKNTVVHSGYKDGLTKQEWFERNKQAYCAEILPAAERCNVNVLCENSTSKNFPPYEFTYIYFTNSGADMREFIDYVDHPNFHGCWDTGHANCQGRNQSQHIIDLGEELYAIHYHDNRSMADEHLLLGRGTLYHEDIFNGLKAINFDGYFTLECTGSQRGNGLYIGPKVDILKDKQVPLTLDFTREEEELLLYQVAEYYVNTYGDGMFDVK
jgi:sugar phosphate isomerase/epimerase